MFDLPTEAQWEYACRAGTTNALNSGKNLTSTYSDVNMNEVGCYVGNNMSFGAKDVGLYNPNRWGLYDMHGNVSEWCLDWYTADMETSRVRDPVGAMSGLYRVIRGGSWNDTAANCRSACRSHFQTNTNGSTAGFRLCWGGHCPDLKLEHGEIDLMPLRNLLKVIDCTKKPDNSISAKELTLAMKNPTVADIDGNTKNISDSEMAIYLWIQELNDMDGGVIISNTIKGDYSQFSDSLISDLWCLSDLVRELKPKT